MMDPVTLAKLSLNPSLFQFVFNFCTLIIVPRFLNVFIGCFYCILDCYSILDSIVDLCIEHKK